ncbi:hypothetical protein [Trueperella sp. LYQ141]|uniref:hypothetical protein n=1 Tax=Trueperella sp. LYQ141 TaxID=3391058 RepID=UPI0039833396
MRCGHEVHIIMDGDAMRHTRGGGWRLLRVELCACCGDGDVTWVDQWCGVRVSREMMGTGHF